MTRSRSSPRGATGAVAPTAPRLPAELSRSDITELDHDLEWSECLVTGDHANQAGEDIVITACRFEQARFTGATLERVRLTDALFEGCELSGTMIEEASFDRVEFRNCRMSGVVLTQSRLRDVRFVGCRLDDASLRMLTAERLAFEDCELARADLYASKLGAPRIFDCNLEGADLSKADLKGARLHGSTLDHVKAAPQLAGAVIDSAQLVPVGLQLLAAAKITIDDDRDPAPVRARS
jgi:uncharacterized protein YjbI with pentapeptide repeats